ncbi:MAG: 2-methylfumaryl-CoA isomerase [Pseudonocardiales bacterium]|jgi:2-methylfumaryl-CoA isomerase|nr:2-methylfumaryl-CoA isomerase [Pseudonocardiales bacterium]
MAVALTTRHWRDLLLMTDMVSPASALEISLGVDFSVEDDRFEYREVLAGLFQRWFAARPVDDVCRALSATSLVWSRYRTFGQAMSHLQTSEGANPIVSVPGPARSGSVPGIGLAVAVHFDGRQRRTGPDARRTHSSGAG